MPRYHAAAVANEFIRRLPGEWPSQIVLQKLTYIANGWSLAITKNALVNEVPEAWDNGPVFRSIWSIIRDFGFGSGGYLEDPTGTVYTANFTPVELEIIEHVWKRYGRLSATQLSAMTHEPNTPWYKTYFGPGRNAPLDLDDVRSHYTGLAMAGRENA